MKILIGYSVNYLKVSGNLWKYNRNEPAFNEDGAIIKFPNGIDKNNNNDSVLFKFKQKMTGQTGAGGAKDVEIMMALKYLIKFLSTLEITLINFETNFILTWSPYCVISTAADPGSTYPITDTKLYVLVVTLSTKDNAKPLQQLKSGFKRTFIWNKYQSTKGQSNI